VQEGLRESDPLTHSFGKVSDEASGAVGHGHHFERFIHAVFGAWNVAQVGHELEIIEHGHVIVEGDGFGQVPHPLADFHRIADDIVPGNDRFPVGGGHVAGKDSHGGGFACAVRPEKADDFSLLGVEIQIMDGAARTIVFGKTGHFDHGLS